MVLLFPRVFWPNVDFLGVVAPTPFACSYFLNLHKATHFPALVFMPAGTMAAEMEQMDELRAVEHTMGQLRKILPQAEEPVRASEAVQYKSRAGLAAGCLQRLEERA